MRDTTHPERHGGTLDVLKGSRVARSLVVRQSMAVFLSSSTYLSLREIPRQSDVRRRATSFAMCLINLSVAARVEERGAEGWGLLGDVDRDVERLQGKADQSSRERMISG